MYVVTLYCIGGEHDGENFVCGPFATFDQAETERGQLLPLGSTETLPLLVDAAELFEVAT